MKKALFAIAAAASVLASCQMAEIGSIDGVKGTTTLKAVIDNEETRTSISEAGGSYKIVWEAGDQVLIVDNNANTYTFTAGEGGSSSTWFQTQDSLELAFPITAYYPWYTANGLASIQNYDGFETPMVATSGTTNLTFKNICGVLRFNLTTTQTGIVVKSINLKADQGMSGAFTMEDGAAKVSGTDSLIIDCGEGVALSTTPVAFFASVPAATYTGLSITVNTIDGKSQTLKTKSGKSITVENSKVHEGTLAFNDFKQSEVGGTAILPAGQDFNAALKAFIDPMATAGTQDVTISKIVFETNSTRTSATNIADIASEKPIYATCDPVGGVVILSTTADTIELGEDASFMFAGMIHLEEIVNLKALDTKNVTTMESMFSMSGPDTSYLKTLDCSTFNTANVTSMKNMFRNIKAKNINVKGFNTANVETMSGMFYFCTQVETLDCSSFNTENVGDMSYMFYNCINLKNPIVSSFKTDNVGTFAYMFYRNWGLESIDLSHFNTESATSFAYLFYWCRNLKSVNVSGWNTESVALMESMFNSCYELAKIDLSSFSAVGLPDKTGVGVGYMFNQCGALEELWFGEDFYKPTNILPYTHFFIASKTQAVENHRTASCNRTGTLVIHCVQECVDWLSQTGLRWINSGATDATPIPVTFLDLKSGATLTPSNGWRAD